MRQATVVFTAHRPEMIPLTEGLMKTHDAVFLEEPPTPGFKEMLNGRLSIDDYLAPIDVEYPEFSKRMCCLARDLHANGTTMVQVEPFLEELIAIHDFFANGSTPTDIDHESLRYAVYLRERNVSGALLAYYRTVMTGTFDESISAIITFARQDAAKFRLRDKLRAIAIANRLKQYRSSYIEAGIIHYCLLPMLKAEIKGEVRVKSIFAARKAISQIGRKGHIYGPGDQLTLLYILHPDTAEATSRKRLLAARSLVYAKLIAKEEITDRLETYPHIRNELDTIAMVNRLSINDCRALFPQIRRSSSAATVEIVKNYLKTP